MPCRRCCLPRPGSGSVGFRPGRRALGVPGARRGSRPRTRSPGWPRGWRRHNIQSVNRLRLQAYTTSCSTISLKVTPAETVNLQRPLTPGVGAGSSQAARVIASLNGSEKTVFRLDDVTTITGQSRASARSFVRKLVDRGIASRAKPGLYVLVPQELGEEKTYLGNPYVLAREIIHPHEYYISHGSAMDIHRMTPRPQLAVTVSTPMVRRPLWVLGTEYRFVRWRRETSFGIAGVWVTKQEAVRVSTIERTVVDGLERPRYSGGIVEVAAGLWRRQADVDFERLVDYAIQLDVGAVSNRLGFRAVLLGLGSIPALRRLHDTCIGAYVLLDPLLPPEGSYIARWRVRVNVDPAEILSTLGA